MEKTPTVLAIGDILIDAFIELQDARVHCNIDDANCEISMRWGDKIPYKNLTVIPAVGNAANAAVSCARLGLDAKLLTHIGNDKHGQECLEALKGNNVGTDYVIEQEGKKTNYHFVLSYEAERTILIKHESFEYDLKRDIGDFIPDWVYFSGTAENSLPYHIDIAAWVKKNNIRMAFQPNTFQITLGAENIKSVYEASELFFCNVEEAQRILKTETADIETLLRGVQALGPKIVCITDGPKGAYAFDSVTGTGWFHPIYPDPKPPVERTGAGDSFSSTFAAAIALGKSVPEALSWGPINSMNVVQYVGAQEGLLSREQLEKHLANRPADYQAKQIF